jgi:Rho guanine nucleotide exchange factor 10
MGVKYRSVSRNSSNASANQKFNGGDLVNINECDAITSTPAKSTADEVDNANAKEQVQPQFSTATMKTKRKNLKSNHHQQMVDGRRTVLTLMGGRGYVNWRHIWHSSPNGASGISNANHSSSNVEAKQHLRSNSVTMPKSQYSTEGHVIIWEKKL